MSFCYIETHAECLNYFNKKWEFFDKKPVVQILDKISSWLKDDFKTWEVYFMNQNKLEGIIDKCELKLFDELFAFNPNQFGFYFPQVSDCWAEIKYDDFVITNAFALSKTVHQSANNLINNLKLKFGRTYTIESGYRSKHYQAYLFLKTMLKTSSIKATIPLIEFPCYSEHQSIINQGVDISYSSFHAHTNPKPFFGTKEYLWLKENSREYNLYLTYTKSNRHWVPQDALHMHFEAPPITIKDIQTPIWMTRYYATSEWWKFIESLPLFKPWTRTKMLYRFILNQKDQKELVSYNNYTFENLNETFAVVDIPVSAYQDCSKNLVRLIALYWQLIGKEKQLQFILFNDKVEKFSQYTWSSFEDWIATVMQNISTQTWRKILTPIKEEELQVWDIIIEPATTFTKWPFYANQVIWHTGIISWIAKDERTNKKYYLIASWSLPVINFRIIRASNEYQWQDWWLQIKGYLLKKHRKSVEFYRISDVIDKFIDEK